MKILVVGSGLMGGAIVFDLLEYADHCSIAIADFDTETLARTQKAVDGNIAVHQLDCEDTDSVRKLFTGYDIAISAVPYRFNYRLSVVAIETKTHFLDLGGNSDIVRSQRQLHPDAKAAGVLLIPDCGIAPGLSNILAMHGFAGMDQVESIHARVGGLPQHPKPPFQYQLVFSVEGLLNEYLEPAEIIDNGSRKRIDPLTGIEQISFDSISRPLEAFYTSGGLSQLPEFLEGKVRELSYKTIRYAGHCERMRMLFDLGFAGSEPVMVGGGVHTSRELFGALLRKKLSGHDVDLVLFRVEITGKKDGKRLRLRYEMIDYFDAETRLSAMMRTTAFPTSIIALAIAQKSLTGAGVYLPEQIYPGDMMIEELKKRNISVTETLEYIDV